MTVRPFSLATLWDGRGNGLGIFQDRMFRGVAPEAGSVERVMMNDISRRRFLGCAAMTMGTAATVCGTWEAADGDAPADEDLPRIDYHAHLDDVVTLEKALELSAQRHVKFGIVEHAGTKANKYPRLISDDAGMKQYLAKLAGKPVLRGIQAEGLDWMTCFSKEVVAQLDYVLSDALTFPEKDGRRVELWRPDVKIADAEDFMERYVDFHVQVMAREPIDILANVSFLPAQLVKDHDALWTPARIQRIIDAAVKYGVAIEINTGICLPKLNFLEMAKQSGATFSFGSNIHGLDVGKLDYALDAAKKLGLKRSDVFSPAAPGQKPIERRQLAS
jgi:histidinol phosphatase-like PHP family hydrolase